MKEAVGASPSIPRIRATYLLTLLCLFTGISSIGVNLRSAQLRAALTSFHPTAFDYLLDRNEGVSMSHTCSTTSPNGSRPPGEDASFGKHFHGNGKLWTVLPLDGNVFAAPNPDGSLWEKFMWWRGVSGSLAVQGHRLDASVGPIHADIPSGYGGKGFQASRLIFPTEGCWEITGTVDGNSLTFIVLVKKRE
jgi:hypothetical protein